jgi:hypothetical protein
MKAAIDGVPFAHSMGSKQLSEARTAIQNANAARRVWIHEIALSIASHNAASASALINQYLADPQVRLAATIAANKSLKPRRRQTLERCFEAAHELNLFKPIPEIVRVYPRKKKSGFRMIHKHALMHRAAQRMVGQVVKLRFHPRSFQFTHLGTHAAMAAIRGSVCDGYQFAAHLDVTDYFGSFDTVKLASILPLPKSVVGSVAVGDNMKVRMDKTVKVPIHLTDDLLLQARLGLPQGSHCSPIIAMFNLAHLDWHACHDVLLANYGDDFLLLAKTEKELQHEATALEKAVRNLPGGHFELKTKSTGSLERGVNFIGHNIRIRDGQLRVSPTAENEMDIFGRLSALDDRFCAAVCKPSSNKLKAAKIAAEMYRLIEGWTAAYRECDAIGEYWIAMMAQVEANAKTLCMDLSSLKELQEPSMQYTVPLYS